MYRDTFIDPYVAKLLHDKTKEQQLEVMAELWVIFDILYEEATRQMNEEKYKVDDEKYIKKK